MRLQLPQRTVEGIAGAADREHLPELVAIDAGLDFSAVCLERAHDLLRRVVEVIDAAALTASRGRATLQSHDNYGHIVERISGDAERRLETQLPDFDLHAHGGS